MSALIRLPSEPITTAVGTVGSADSQQVIHLANGNYVVVYSQWDTDGSARGVFLQTFDPLGARVGGATQVNVYTSNWQSAPTIAALTGGGYVVSWTSEGQDGSDGGIYARTFSDAGVAQTGEVLVNTTVTGWQGYSSIAALNDGGYVITWMGKPGDGHDIHFQRYNASGVAVGSETLVNTTTANDQWEPEVTGLAGGGFVIVWQSIQSNSPTGDQEIFAQRYDASGVAVGSQVTVSSGVTNTGRSWQKVAALPDGGYIVAWSEYEQGGGTISNILSQRFDSSGAKTGGVVLVNTNGPHATNPEIEVFADGGYFISWGRSAPNQSASVRYQLFDATGAKVGGETVIPGLDRPGTLATAPDGSFLYSSSSQVQSAYVITNTMFVNAASGDGGDNALMGTTAAEFITGLGGSDTIQGDTGMDRLYGWDGNDVLIGGHDADSLYGEDGADVLFGETGDDKLIGGTGDDRLYGQDGADTLWGETGNDLLNGGDGNDALYGQDGMDTLEGANGNDSLYGGSVAYGEEGDDVLSGGGQMFGGNGNDLISKLAGRHFSGIWLTGGPSFGEDGNDTITGGWDDNLAYGQKDNDVLFGEGGNDTLYGGADDDRIYGQGQDDILIGEDGNDTLDGGTSDDALIGGAGADQLAGGTGKDNFYYTSRTEPADAIVDFSHAEGDKFVFTGSAFNVPAGFTLTAGVGLLQGAGVTPVAQTATFYYDTTTKALWYDADGTGSGGANVIAFLLNTPTLDTSDFIFV